MSRSPLVLVHGFTATPRCWDPIRPLLAEHHEVHTPVVLGHCGGDPLPEHRRHEPLTAMVDGLEAFLDAHGLRRAHLVGNSLGGWLALELAARGRAETVVALSPGGGWEDDRETRRIVRQFRLAHHMAPLGVRLLRTIASRPRLRALALRDLLARPEHVSPATAAALIEGATDCAIYEPFLEALRGGAFPRDLGAIDVPVRIAWGTEDRVLPRDRCSAHHRRVVPDAEWVELPGLGHLPQVDDPVGVARVVLEVTARDRAAA